MLISTNKIIPEHIDIKVESAICDLCGEQYNHIRYDTKTGKIIWNLGPIYCATTIRLESGYNIDDYSNIYTTEYHLCKTCFKTMCKFIERNRKNKK